MFAIILTVFSLLLITNKISPTKGMGLLDPNKRWPKNIVPYVIDIDDYNDYDIYLINQAIKEIRSKTCIRFVWHTTEPNHIKIHDGKDKENNCGSVVGMANHGMQDLFLRSPNCMKKYTIIHELLHTLGLEHMHDSSDRDNYIDIDFTNIPPDKYKNFKKVNSTDHSYFGTAYDPESILHYGGFYYAIDPSKRTIYGKNTEIDRKIGINKQLSEGDITRINNMYNCPVKR